MRLSIPGGGGLIKGTRGLKVAQGAGKETTGPTWYLYLGVEIQRERRTEGTRSEKVT